MNIDKNSSLFKETKMKFRKYIKPLIISSCGSYSSKAFKQALTIQELLEQESKHKNDSERFQLYVLVIDTIVNEIKIKFPFVDLTGMDMTWTTEQIIEVVTQAYLSLPCLTLKDLGVEMNNERGFQTLSF